MRFPGPPGGKLRVMGLRVKKKPQRRLRKGKDRRGMRVQTALSFHLILRLISALCPHVRTSGSPVNVCGLSAQLRIQSNKEKSTGLPRPLDYTVKPGGKYRGTKNKV